MGAGVLALGAEDGGEGEGGSKLVQTALTDGVTTGEANGLGHEALAAAAVEQTVPTRISLGTRLHADVLETGRSPAPCERQTGALETPGYTRSCY